MTIWRLTWKENGRVYTQDFTKLRDAKAEEAVLNEMYRNYSTEITQLTV
jgi:hypothetical protein